jgi:hypothetical protein
VDALGVEPVMARLLVHVEGETEETFVNEVICPHLVQFGFETVGARLIGNARQRDRRGGIRAWPDVRKDILRHLTEDRECFSTMMVDYYGLPKTGDRAWPGRDAASALPVDQKAASVERAVSEAIAAGMGSPHGARRFVPFVVLHEFEGLLFSDCAAFADAIGSPALAQPFQAIRDAFATPEHINDSPATAPSKRIQELVPQYQKPLYGNLAALGIGLTSIRSECPNFHRWMTTLEELPD